MATYQDIIKGWTNLGYGNPGELMQAGQQGTIYQDPSTGKRWVLGEDWQNPGGMSMQEFGRPEGGPVYQFGADGNSTGSQQFTYNNKDAGILGNVAGFVNDTSGFWGPALAMATGANFLGGTGGFGGMGGLGEAAGSGAAGVGEAGWGMDLGMGGLEGVGAGITPAGIGGAAGAAGGGTGSWLSGILGNGGGGLGALGSAVGGLVSGAGGGGSAGGTGGLGGVLSGLYDYYQQNQASDKMLDYVKGAQQKVDDIYSPGSEYQKYMWDAMSAKDAAAGRNSQYGPRTQGFMGQYAKDYATATSGITQSLSGMFQNGVNKSASAGAGVATGLGNYLGGGNLGQVIQNASSYLSNPQAAFSQTPVGSSGFGTGLAYGNQDYGDYL